MENDAATLYCPNELCQAANPLTHKFCQRCSTPLPKRYLWAAGDGLLVGSPGEILADRYLVISKSVVLDTKPGLIPQAPELDSLQNIKAYLRLIPYRLHVPQVYGVLSVADRRPQKEILLLEKPPLLADNTATQVQLCSQLTTAWRDATSMRQLNWLWQIAHLWQPLKTEGVVSSLLDPHLQRVEGPLVRLLDLRSDSDTAVDLSQLGEFWRQLLLQAKPAIAEFVNQISNLLIQKEINSPEVLIAILDRGLAELGRSQTPTIKIITKTDTGPSRQRNEDACYPPSGTMVSKPPQATALAIVCDGIGGHEGGNVASNLAIETIQQQVQQLTKVPYDHIEPSLLLADLESAVAVANDKISQRNDGEHRQGRQRMGTTLVMALPIAQDMYITHVGDSRAYWITKHGCYQVTLDDDVASREVRLGYAIYREAVTQGGAGSLVQALGMSASNSLHPTSQRFILDEDAIFLLTSDGLSDFDRVEEYWETEILPVLAGEENLGNVADRLVEIANSKNGHDNVTIALVHHQVKYFEPEVSLKAVMPDSLPVKVANSASIVQATLPEDNPKQKTKVIPETKPATNTQLPLHLVVAFLFVAAAVSVAYLIMRLRLPSNTIPVLSPSTTLQPTASKPPQERSLDNLAPGWVIKTSRETTLENKEPLPPGSFLEVIEKKPTSQPAGGFLVDMRLCSNEGTLTSADPNKKVGSRLPTSDKRVVAQLSQLKRFQVTVLQADNSSPCDSIPQSPDSQPPAPNPQTDTNAGDTNNR
ncbi:protein phosphatase 2C domain-containing protein [Nostoc sp. CENA67]|uniref:Protein phosphatase 2C domain-containing protein n=1 Tax=Amazonocrinis nigriterrae CENA67 TaxID=2794033 RepID=A0A8J7L7Q0_9NOST|nr:PP2C family serine/threonine-protein phosphatase [Amazonocrinis nigriterrae]MBH8562538.1 protein phosphatase 2C domain-containing protein [Amazonocrinis nigriterrae CENA67]